MLRFYYNPNYKYTNRKILNVLNDTNYVDKDYQNIDSPDTINGHIIYQLSTGERLPTYIVDLSNNNRWYVSGITQLRTGKFQISLLRDIISESPDTWKSEEAYISSGLANDFNLYKRWNLPYTNTKVKEERLNINGKSSFFVYYVNTQQINGNVITEQDLAIKSSSIPGITGYDYTVSNLNEIPSYEFVNAGKVRNWTKTAGTTRVMMAKTDITFLQVAIYPWNYDSSILSNNGFNVGAGIDEEPNYLAIKTLVSDVKNNKNNCRTNFRTATINFLNTLQASYGTQILSTQIGNLMPYVNKIIYNSSDNKVYTIRLKTSNGSFNEAIPKAQCAEYLTALKNCNFPHTTSGPLYNWQEDGDSWFVFKSEYTDYIYTLEEIGTATSFEFNFQASQRKLPKSAVRCVNLVSSGNISDEEIAQSLMLSQTNGINENGDTGRILDIQYLPFSIATLESDNFKINNNKVIASFLDNDDFQYVTTLPTLTNINKETDSIKIVSPSRASQFLFRPYDNNGKMVFTTKITIKPYASVIYVRPSTQGLLLQDWDDKDCLIINEDFSLTNVSSNWTNYIYNNRNYQNAFERQIQGREFERSWERRIEEAQRQSDDWTARNISAQKAQTYTGNLPIISSIAGAIGTAFQDQNYMQMAQLDREYNEALYQEGMSLSRDLFSMQMDNIQSQPAIPTRVTTIDAKFLDGVYLEYYSTNDTEKQAIRNFYKYNGNRVDAYGTFFQYWGWFVRGKIIRAQNYTQPEIDELNRRLSMGIFTEVEYA